MGTVNGFTAEHMQAILDGTIDSATLDGSYHLILHKIGGGTIDVGNIRGATGATGPGGTITSVNGKTGSVVVLDAATTAALGTVLLATSAEAIAGTDSAKAVTSAALAAVTGTSSRRGLLQLATSAEVLTGTDTAKVVTPKGLADDLLLGYRKMQTLRINASTTFDKTAYPGLRAIRVICIGGGGGSGGIALTAASQVSASAAGGAGAYAESWITDLTTVALALAVTIGAGGIAGTLGGVTPTNSGGAGGTTSFGALVVAGGGSGGGAGAAAAITGVPTSGAAGGTPTTGDIQFFGMNSTPPQYLNVAFLVGSQPGWVPGYASPRQAIGPGGGNTGSTPIEVNGGGGANASYQAQSNATGRVGGAGAAGQVIVELYA